jgi:DNA primase
MKHKGGENMPKGKKPDFVKYKELKENVSMEMVLRRYGIFESLKPSGKNLVGCCPIHQGSNPNQFSVSLERNLFNCFGNCKAGGNIIDFVVRMERVEVHQAALLLQKWFLSGNLPAEGVIIPKTPKLVREGKPGAKNGGSVNAPLSFKLKGLDSEHQFFVDHGISPETAKYFEAGFCSKGLMAGRIAIPIHNQAGELVAYCGRAINQEQAEKEGKYKLPGGFLKQRVIYNLNRLEKNDCRLVLVESFLSVWKLYQYGYKNVVALMGSVLGEDQARLIIETLGPAGLVILLFDADEDGEGCTTDCLKRLSRSLYVRAPDLARFTRKPHHLTAEQAKALLSD